ncbi:nucleotide exchange factor GrpE [Gimesia maris]|uniref:Protein GrpE n=1 Tax=Gimesia maris TaxID=122 RepID=A0ABX5YRF6_9PLAN|nr:nucleotide exchange factor GrpE [Gimesia maris]EDL59219.1 GrpE protein HSP-70 cofactor [Gimesia maris DSM 8797]QEG18238.1 Protein GrpE [Gimesia maris]QGQ28764.1 nucleotide exchange factor GrpE [Gimesia maris]
MPDSIHNNELADRVEVKKDATDSQRDSSDPAKPSVDTNPDAESQGELLESMGSDSLSPEHDIDETLKKVPPSGVENEGSSALASEIQNLSELVQSSEQRVLTAFEKKLAYDKFKEEQISRLHDEMQEYKRGLADSLMMPLIKQLIRYLDQIPRHVEALQKKSADELGPDRLTKELNGVRDDLEMILENVGVTVFTADCSKIDRKLQLARLTVNTDNQEQHGAVIESLLPGYQFNGKIVEQERVKVSVYREVPKDTTSETAERNS